MGATIVKIQSVVCVAAIPAIFLTAGCDGPHVSFGPAIRGDGNIVRETRTMDEFDKMEVSGAIHASFEVGKEFQVVVETDENLLPFIATTVDDGKLRIHWDRHGSVQPTKAVSIRVTAPRLEGVSVSGASTADCRALAEDSLEVRASGASKVRLEGSAKTLDVDASGASRLDGSKFVAGHVKIDVSGASSVKVVASESIEGEASGASSVRYGGSASRIEVDTSGASSVKREKEIDNRRREL